MGEDVNWDSLREELFTNATFGYRFRRTGRRTVEVMVPDGRNFFLPHGALSFTELQFAFLDVALRIASFRPRGDTMLYVLDSTFFQRLNGNLKVDIFRKMTTLNDQLSQTLFCVHEIKDAEMLKDVRPDNWVNAQRLGKLTLHSFL